MSYDLLSPKPQEVLDRLMSIGGQYEGRGTTLQAIAHAMHISPRTLKAYIKSIGLAYSVDPAEYHTRIRICYLRAKELGLI